MNKAEKILHETTGLTDQPTIIEAMDEYAKSERKRIATMRRQLRKVIKLLCEDDQFHEAMAILQKLTN